MNRSNKLFNWLVILFLFLVSPSVHSQINEQASLTPSDILGNFGPAVVLIEGASGEGGIALGTGFIVSADGIIITNYHVIKGSYPAMVKLANGDIYDRIDVLEWDALKDLVLIKIPGFNLPTVELGDSDNSQIGESVVVIGNPFGLEQSISDGLLSGVREMEGYRVFQISAPISSGSSGSPVFNMQGKVIGVAFAALEEGQNLNFCIPINYARGLLGSERRITLEEFSQLDTDPVSFGGQESQGLPRSEALIIFGNCLRKIIYAQDCIWLCREEARTAGYYRKHTFEPVRWHEAIIPPELYDAKTLAHEALTMLDNEFLGAPEDLNDFAQQLREIANKFDEGLNLVFSSGAVADVESWQNAWIEVNDAQTELRYLIDQINQLIDEIRVSPDDVISAYPQVIFIQPQNPNRGMLGAGVSEMVEPLIVFHVLDDTAAAGKLKIRDVILGVVGGPLFSSITEFFNFMDTTSPGQEVIFLIRREGDEKEITVRLSNLNE